MRPFKTILLFGFITGTIQLHAQLVPPQREETERAIQKGNDLYKQQQYQQAEALYNEVLEKEPSNSTAKYNRAIAVYKQTKPEEAIKALDDLAFKSEEND